VRALGAAGLRLHRAHCCDAAAPVANRLLQIAVPRLWTPMGPKFRTQQLKLGPRHPPPPDVAPSTVSGGGQEVVVLPNGGAQGPPGS